MYNELVQDVGGLFRLLDLYGVILFSVKYRYYNCTTRGLLDSFCG